MRELKGHSLTPFGLHAGRALPIGQPWSIIPCQYTAIEYVARDLQANWENGSNTGKVCRKEYDPE